MIANLVLNGVNGSMRPCLFAGRPGISSWCDKTRNITGYMLRGDPSLPQRRAWHHLVARRCIPAVWGLLELSAVGCSHTVCRVLLIAAQAIVGARKYKATIGHCVQHLPAGLATIHAVQVDEVCWLDIFFEPTRNGVHRSNIHGPEILGEVIKGTTIIFRLSMS